jgi:Holliday junction resolvase RusA-like endonuclease
MQYQPKEKLGPAGKSMSYIIDGEPIPLARHRHGKGHGWDSQKQLKLGIGLQISNQHNNLPFLEGPLKLEIVFYMPIPLKGAKTLNGTIHTIRPDLDNLIKMICDVANGIAYKDDCVVASIIAHKQYSTLPRTEFTLTELRAR